MLFFLSFNYWSCIFRSNASKFTNACYPGVLKFKLNPEIILDVGLLLVNMGLFSAASPFDGDIGK